MMSTRRPLVASVGVVLLACAAPCAMAQNDPTDLPGAQALREEAQAESQRFHVSVFGGGLGVFRSDFQDNGASIATYFARTGVDMSLKATETVRFNFGLAYEAAFYDIDNGREVFPELDEDDPFDTLNSVALAGTVQWYVSDPWFLVAGGSATAGWEAGAEFSEMWTYSGFGAVGYRFSDRLSLALGAGAVTRLEDDPIVYPVITVRWQATDHLTVESEGLGIRVTSALNDKLDAFFRVGYEGRSYRLDEDRDPEPGSALEDRAVYVGIGVGWMPIPNLRVALEGGAVVYRELLLWDSDGHKLSSEETDVAPFAGLTVRYSF